MGCTSSKAATGPNQPKNDLVQSRSIPASAPSAPAPQGPVFENFPPPNDGRDAISRTDSLDGSQRSQGSVHSRRRSMKNSLSALGLDEMINDKRNAKKMSERVVHIEVPFGKPIEEVYSGVHDGPVLGSGISGLVRLATHKATGLKYAIKCLDLCLVDTEEGLQQLREEIYIMCQLDHPNIVRLEEVYESHSEIYLVQELCLGGELFDRLDEQPDYHYTEAQCARLIKQMLCSVRYIHSKGIIHRDLKLENFLFSSKGADSELKMIDFGLSKHFKFGEVQHEAVGTPYTVAPEVIRGSYDERCDVWAIGVITYLLLSGESPFGGCGGPEPLMEVRENILKCNFVFEPEEIWERVSTQARAFINRLLVTDPNLRPTAREVQRDPWLLEMADKSKKHDDRVLNPSVVKALVNFKEYSHMRKLLCEVLSFTLIPDQIQGLRKEFEKMDTDGSGEISLSALKTVLLGNAAQGSLGALTEEEVEDIFNAMRVSKTQTTIHWHEFIAAGLSHCKVDERNLKLAFDRLDSDHTGYITFENFMDLVGNGAMHSEEALRQMWGEAAVNNTDAHITYEDFLLLMKGQQAQPKIQPMLDKMELHPVHEADHEHHDHENHEHIHVHGGFLHPASFDENESEEGPICMDDEEGIVLDAGPKEGGGFLANGTTKPEDAKNRSQSFDADSGDVPPPADLVVRKGSKLAINLPEHKHDDATVNSLLSDKSKTPLVVNRELYRAHRNMRLAVLEASKRLEEEQQRRAREELRKEQARSNKAAGLIMRHGGELSADAIKLFVIQQQKEEEKKILDASKRSGRRHARNRTASDIRGMFGTGNKEAIANPSRNRSIAQPNIPEYKAVKTPAPSTSELPELPKVRDATKPGQFRRTTYDPFGFTSSVEGGGMMRESSFHRHLDMGVVKSKSGDMKPVQKIHTSGSDTQIKKANSGHSLPLM